MKVGTLCKVHIPNHLTYLYVFRDDSNLSMQDIGTIRHYDLVMIVGEPNWAEETRVLTPVGVGFLHIMYLVPIS